MSKGSSYWGTARGKIGNTVVSVVRGQRIERAYQPSVNNPRTPKQMIQRAKFFSAVEFFKNSRQGLFKMAFEDKRQNESDYNAFMRHNAALAPMLSRKAVDMGDGARAQAIWTWQVSNGSLEPVTVRTMNDAPRTYGIDFIAAIDSVTTVGQLSTMLINSGFYMAGDIVTIVEHITDITEASPDDGEGLLPAFLGERNTPNEFMIKQFALSSTSQTPLSDFNLAYSEEQGMLVLTSYTTTPDTLRAAAVIVSRPGTTLKVSTANMVPDSYTQTYFDVMKTDNWQQGILTQWQTAEAVILEGALV